MFNYVFSFWFFLCLGSLGLCSSSMCLSSCVKSAFLSPCTVISCFTLGQKFYLPHLPWLRSAVLPTCCLIILLYIYHLGLPLSESCRHRGCVPVQARIHHSPVYTTLHTYKMLCIATGLGEGAGGSATLGQPLWAGTHFGSGWITWSPAVASLLFQWVDVSFILDPCTGGDWWSLHSISALSNDLFKWAEAYALELNSIFIFHSCSEFLMNVISTPLTL